MTTVGSRMRKNVTCIIHIFNGEMSPLCNSVSPQLLYIGYLCLKAYTNVRNITSMPSSHCIAGLDDVFSNRTSKAIPNVNGIIKFYVGQGHVTSLTPQAWIDVGIKEHYEVIVNTHARMRAFCTCPYTTQAHTCFDTCVCSHIRTHAHSRMHTHAPSISI